MLNIYAYNHTQSDPQLMAAGHRYWVFRSPLVPSDHRISFRMLNSIPDTIDFDSIP